MGSGEGSREEESVSKTLIVEPEAEGDISEAYAWYEGRSTGLGEDFLLCLQATFEAIAERPRSFPIVYQHARRALVRRFPYLVLFVEHADVLIVMGVIHAARHPRLGRQRVRRSRRGRRET